MPYARIGDELATSDALLDAVEECVAAGTAYLVASSKSAGEGTDGRVKRRWILAALTDPDLTDAALAALVRTGLFHDQGDGTWTIDGWLDRNISREEWEARQQAEREKKARQRARKRAQSPDLSPGDTPRDDQRESPRGPLTRPDQTRPEEETSSSLRSSSTPPAAPVDDDDRQSADRPRVEPGRRTPADLGEARQRLATAEPPWTPAVLEALKQRDWTTVDRAAVVAELVRHNPGRNVAVAAAREAVERASRPEGAGRIRTPHAAQALGLRLADWASTHRPAPPAPTTAPPAPPPTDGLDLAEIWDAVLSRTNPSASTWIENARLVGLDQQAAWIRGEELVLAQWQRRPKLGEHVRTVLADLGHPIDRIHLDHQRTAA